MEMVIPDPSLAIPVENDSTENNAVKSTKTRRSLILSCLFGGEMKTEPF